MREIKFRGKNNDVWHFGNLQIVKHKEYDTAYIVKNKPERPLAIPVVLETIGQFTGLQDSKGNDIYEGDIVKCNEFIYRVAYDDKRFASFVLIRKQDIFRHYFGEAMDANACEVIGNIHDNPELMEANQ